MRARALVLALLVPIPAFAEPSAADRALAQSLFKDGRALLTAGKTNEACAKLAESDRLDPQLGTHLNLALCHEAQGKNTSAWVEFGEVADLAEKAHDDERATFARQHARDLETKLARVRLLVDAPTTGMTIAIDGAPIGQVGWSSVPLDPGSHDLRAEAPGKKPFSIKFDVPATTQLAVPVLENASATNEPPLQTAPPVTPAPSSGSPLRTVGFVTVGVGVVGLVIGGIFGAMTIAQNDKANADCVLGATMNRCTQVGVDAGKNASTFAAVSTFGFVGGAVLAGAGVTLIVVGKPAKTTGMVVAPTLGGVSLFGRF